MVILFRLEDSHEGLEVRNLKSRLDWQRKNYFLQLPRNMLVSFIISSLIDVVINMADKASKNKSIYS